jgi:outer membrane immunogenic protein
MRNIKVAVSVFAVGAILSISAASAADLPARTYTKAPAVTTAAYDWTGFYVGVNAGGAWGRVDPFYNFDNPRVIGPGAQNAFVQSLTNQPQKTSGFTGGGQVGYNYQVQQLVFGLEADINFTDLRQSRTSPTIGPPICAPPGCSITQSYSTDWLATFRARAGFAAGSWLLYATGGLAVADVRYNDIVNFPGSVNTGSSRETRAGWTAGVGAEWAFSPNWSIKAEYLYVDLGSTSYILINNSIPLATIPVDHNRLTENIGRVGINYKFGGPVVARY